MDEEWRDVIGYEGYYQVSNLGRVMRIRGSRGATAGRILKPKMPTHSCDYCRVDLSRGDVKHTLAVHTIVAEAFIGKRPRNKFANHKDLCKTNNCSENLEWMTRKQNARHAVYNGRSGGKVRPGESNPRAKLSAEQVREIRRLNGVVGQRTLAVLCGVSKTAIQLIQQGKNWQDVPDEWPADLRVRQYPELRRELGIERRG